MASPLSQGTPAALTSPLAGYAAKAAGRQHLDFIGANGDVHELHGDDPAALTDDDLTALTGAPTAAALSALVAYVTSDGGSHVAFVDGSGHVHELRSAAGGWVDEDLTASATPDRVPSANPPIAAPGPHALAAYAETGNGTNRHVDFLDASGHVHDLFNGSGASSWAHMDLTAMIHATSALPGSALASYWGSNGSQHIDYVDGSGDVHELSMRSGGFWGDMDLTAASSGTPAAPGATLVGYWGSEDGQPVGFGSNAGLHVDFLDSAGDVHELHYPGDTLVDDDVTSSVHGRPAIVNALAGYWGSDSSQHVAFIDGNDDVHELSWTSTASWIDLDLTEAAGAGAPASATAGLAAYAAGDGSQHVAYVTSGSGEVRDLVAP
jgi:hypothetical protein